MSVNLQILHEIFFLNKEREKWWKTIGMCSTQEDKETAQVHFQLNLEKETYTTICCCLMGK